MDMLRNEQLPFNEGLTHGHSPCEEHIIWGLSCWFVVLLYIKQGIQFRMTIETFTNSSETFICVPSNQHFFYIALWNAKFVYSLGE